MTCAVYRAFDSAGALLYVGISENPEARLNKHRFSAAWYPKADKFSVEWHGSRAVARADELAIILRDGPIYNIVGSIKEDAPFAVTARRVATVRSTSGLTQLEFAKSIGCKRAQLSNWESGQQRLSLSGAIAIREIYDVSLDWLFPTPEAAS